MVQAGLIAEPVLKQTSSVLLSGILWTIVICLGNIGPIRRQATFFSWRTTERSLLALFLLLMASLLWRTWNVPQGFDWEAHVHMVREIRWFAAPSPLFTHFYDYHPPLSFLLARIPYVLGMPEAASVQMLSAISCLTVFMGLRASLQLLGLLQYPAAVLFLYGIVASPLYIFLATSINMESLVLGLGSLTLYLSLRLSKTKVTRRVTRATTIIIGLTTVVLLAAFLTKFNGVLLAVLPPLCALLFSSRTNRRMVLLITTCCVVAAAVLAFPYYYGRYYAPLGTFLPSNTNVYDASHQADARNKRDADPTRFVLAMFSLPPTHQERLSNRDLDMPRLADTWQDFWVRDTWLGAQEGAARIISTFYVYMAAAGCLLGLLLLPLLSKRNNWTRLGILFLFLGCLHLFLLAFYCFKNPWGGALPNKGIYLAPLLWSISFLLSMPFAVVDRVAAFRAFTAWIHTTGLVILVTLLCVNYIVPIY